jgi:Bacterial Ig-like domain
MKLLRISISTLATALALMATSMVPAAQAGTYDVLACDAAPGAVNNSWTYETNDSSHIAGSTSCPSSSDYSGLLADTILGLSSGSPAGAYGQWIVHAPAGTTITRIRLRRFLYMDGGSGWTLYGRTADGVTISGETCTVQPGFDDCQVGGYASPTLDRTVNTTSIAYGFVCTTTGVQCVTGATIHAAAAAIYSARVTINDPTAPTITTPSGSLVATSGYHQGTESVIFNGSDALGLSTRRVYVDGTQLAADAPACDFTQLVPCSNPATDATLSVDTTSLADGQHTVQAAVVDAAGNESRSAAVSITVDNTAPTAPVGLQAAPRTDSDPAVTASWSNPSGQVAPIIAAHWTLCPQGSASGCQSGSTTATSMSGSLPAEGDYTLSVALEDAAGHVGPAGSLALRYQPPVSTPTPTPTPTATATPAPTATPTPTPQPRSSAQLKLRSATLTRHSRSLSAAGTLARSASGKLRVTVRYRVGHARRSRTIIATVHAGRFSAHAHLASADARHARSLTAVASYAGDAHYGAATSRRTVKVRR